MTSLRPRFPRLRCELLEDRTTPDAGDTIALAQVSGLSGNGFIAFNEPIGDNTFGSKDVDFFSVVATAGNRLTVSTTQRSFGGTILSTFARLFDATGKQITSNDDSNGVYSRLTATLPAAGTYFVGISGSPNFNYNPNTANSGVAGAKGDYTINLSFEAAISWTSQGPGPITGGQVEGMNAQNNPVAGAIECVSTHPTDGNTIYIGGTNGGVWKTTNGGTTWVPTTDSFAIPSLSIGGLEFDPTDSTFNTLYAGIGRMSSLGSEGGEQSGVLRTTDGGATWTNLGRGTTNSLPADNIRGIAARGSTIVVGMRTNGLYRSTDGGANYTKLSGAGGTGLPTGDCYDIIPDPSTSTRLFTGTKAGVFRSENTGATWTDITPPQWVANPTNLEMGYHFNAAAKTQALYFGSTTSGSLHNVWRSVDNGTNYSTMGVAGSMISGTPNPVTDASNASPIVITDVAHGLANNAYVFVQGCLGNTAANGTWRVNVLSPDTFALIGSTGNGVYTGGGMWGESDGLQPAYDPEIHHPPGEYPGGQGNLHFSMVADPVNPNLVYIGGDRQPSPFPNSIGAKNFTGRLFRGDATKALGSMWSPLTHIGTSSISAPHADSRDMEFTVDGHIIEGDDGGVYRRNTPHLNTGDWTGLIGTNSLIVTESHSAAYDSLNNIFTIGTQDVGSARQTTPGGKTWTNVNQGDGGVVQIAIEGSEAYRYSSSQFLGGFRRQIFNSSNTQTSSKTIALNAPGLGAGVTLFNMSDDSIQFYTPYQINPVEPNRMLIGANKFLYESSDRGTTVERLASGDFSFIRAIAYGHAGNKDVIYATGNTAPTELVVRESLAGGLVNRSANYPGFYAARNGIAIDPDAWQTAYILDFNGNCYRTTDAGATAGSWTNITGNLLTISGNPRRLTIYDGPTSDLLVAAGNSGVFAMNTATPGIWSEIGHDLPNCIAYDARVYQSANLLSLGTLGRGVWSIAGFGTNFDTQGPAVPAIALVEPNPNAGPTVAFTVTFAEPAIGLTATNFLINIAGYTGTPTFNNITGSGTTWTVTLNTAGGSGTLGLNWNTPAEARDLAGNLVAAGTVTGPQYTIVNGPGVTSYTVNNLTTQRSRILEIAVNFASPVNAASFAALGAITLTRTTGAPVGTLVQTAATGVNGRILVSPGSGMTSTLTLTFDNADGAPISAGVENASLADGRWRLAVPAAAFQSVLDDTTLRRLFGDDNADGTVDGTDFGVFGAAFGGANVALDFDANGTIDGTDFGQFGAHFGLTI